MNATQSDRWLLPEGIQEVLPDEARQLETLRRELLDLFGLWGYEL
ncbi:MAG: ATP phosphoribosyltransferase regulatory subunit, partial [Methylococcales bacterium]